MKLAAGLMLAGALMAAAVTVQAAHDRAYPALSGAPDQAIYIASPTALRRLTVGFNALAADAYWIRAIQYYGGAKRKLESQASTLAPPAMLADTSDYDQLYQLLDVTTSLDPRFDIAYRFGAVFLAESYPSGPGRPDLAIALLEKGLRERADKWQYMEDIGYIYYWYLSDYKEAASRFERAAEIPGAPNWLKPLAATTLAQGGDRRTSRVMWLSILQDADEDWLRTQAEHRLQQLQALDQIDELQARVGQVASRTGQTPHDWRDLVRAGALRGIPIDPSGTPYTLTSEGTVQLGARSKLFPLPNEPLKLPPAS